MKVIPKEDLDKQLGKKLSWLGNRAVGLSYLSGIDVFNTVRDANPKLPAHFDIIMRKDGIELAMMYGFKSTSVGIALSDIMAVELKLPEEIVTEKERSVLGRAVIGGVLLGPVGMLVGGMSGLQKGKQTEHTDAIFTMSVIQGGEESYLIASRKRGIELNVLRDFLKSDMKQFYKE